MKSKSIFRLGIASASGFCLMLYVLWNWVFPLTTAPLNVPLQILAFLLMLFCILLAFVFLATAMFCIVVLEPDGGSVI